MQKRDAKPSVLERTILFCVLSLSAFLNFYRLNRVGINGMGNIFYAAGVKSMLTSWHNFLYLSFDPAGFLAMDKAPLALWIQTICSKVFGLNSWALIGPQALAGVLSVYIIYRMVGRSIGRWWGLFAAFTLSITPISIVTNRNNTPDALLTMFLLLAAWALIRATESGKLRWLLISSALVAVAFNTKLLQILLVLPAFVTLYLVAANISWKQRLINLFFAIMCFLIIAAPWVLMVELTPEDQRPYISSTQGNSMLELIFGYNGVTRLWGEDWSALIGVPGPQRLFVKENAGQISWLLPIAFAGAVASVVRLRCWSRRDVFEADPDASATRNDLLLWGTWLGMCLLYFSASTFYHRYYMTTMAPAVAALAAHGAHEIWSIWNSATTYKWFALLALLLNAATQILFLIPFPKYAAWLIPIVVVLNLIGLSSLFFRVTVQRIGLLLGVASLSIAPVVWTFYPVLNCAHHTLPIAGPQECEPFEERPYLDPELMSYLYANRQGAQYMAATYDTGISAFGIMESGEPFLTMGGYRGTDPILSLREFEQMVRAGEVRIILRLTESPIENAQEEIYHWVQAHCPVAELGSQGIEVRGPCEL